MPSTVLTGPFVGTNGNAPAAPAVVDLAGAGSSLLIASNKGRFHCGAVGSNAATVEYRSVIGGVLNGEITGTFVTPSSLLEWYLYQSVRAPDAWPASGSVGFGIETAAGSGSGAIVIDDGTPVSGSSPTIVASHTYGFRGIFVGQLLIWRVWDITAGGTEATGAAVIKMTTNQPVGSYQAQLTGGVAATAFDIDLDVTVTAYACPYPVADRGSLANATGATTSVITLTNPTSIAVGNYLFLRVEVDNSGTNGASPGITSVVDSKGNTYTVVDGGLADPGAANAGSKCFFILAKVTTAFVATNTITITWTTGSPPAKAIVVEEWANVHPTTPLAGISPVTLTGATTAVSGSITPTKPDQVVIATVGIEGPNADTVTYDADATEGTWLRATALGSTDATATNNQKVYGQVKAITTARQATPGAQTLDMTLGTARDWAGVLVVIQPPPGALPFAPRRHPSLMRR